MVTFQVKDVAPFEVKNVAPFEVKNVAPFVHGPKARVLTKLDATWSNGQAIKEYQDFLAGKKADVSAEDVPSLIMWDGGENSALMKNALLAMGDEKDIVIHPWEPIPETLEGQKNFPIYVVVAPCMLESTLQENLIPKWLSRSDDLVYLSSPGVNIEPILKKFSLPRDATSQLLCGFTTPPPPYFPRDLSVNFGTDTVGEPKISMESLACGKWKDAIASRLENSDIRCRRVFARDYRRGMWERSVMDAAFHLVGGVRAEKTTFKDVAEFYHKDLSDMLWQMSTMMRGSLAITLTYGFEERMFEYAHRRGEDILCTIHPDTFPFCNGVFWDISKIGLQMGFGDPAPLHTEYLEYAVKHLKLLDFDMPQTKGDQRPGIMREGNLRADGVI